VKRKDPLRRALEEQGLTSAMNATRWRAAIAALRAIENFSVRFRVKSVLEKKASTHWETSFPWHVPTRETIEWLEIDPITLGQVDFTEAITQALRGARAPFTVVAGKIRILGYLRG
jgi:hypothetical protein